MVKPENITTSFLLSLQHLIPLKFIANRMGVTKVALYHRLYRGGRISKLEAEAIADFINKFIEIGAISKEEVEQLLGK